ncbi:unnamed protein product [Closterium sp. Yama58-4]|nr:unnamed protein product [Closterium sp. Yama58-4]
MRICGVISRGKSASPTDRPSSPIMSPSSRSTFSSLPRAYTATSASLDPRTSPAWTREKHGEPDHHYSVQSPYMYKPTNPKPYYTNHLPRVNEVESVSMGNATRFQPSAKHRFNFNEERNTSSEFHSSYPARMTASSAYMDRGTRMHNWEKESRGYEQDMQPSNLIRSLSTSVYDQVSTKAELTRHGLASQNLAHKFSPCFSPESVSGDSIDMMSSAGVTTDTGSWVDGHQEAAAVEINREKASTASNDLLHSESSTRRSSTSGKVLEKASARSSGNDKATVASGGNDAREGQECKQPASSFQSLSRVVVAELSVYKNVPPEDIVKLWSAVLTLIGFRDASYDSSMKTKAVWRDIQKRLITASTNQQHKISSIYYCLKEAEAKFRGQPPDASTVRVVRATLPGIERVTSCSKPAKALHAWVISALEPSLKKT